MQHLKAVYMSQKYFLSFVYFTKIASTYNLVMCLNDRTAHAFMMYDVWLEQVVVRSKTTFSNADRCTLCSWSQERKCVSGLEVEWWLLFDI